MNVSSLYGNHSLFTEKTLLAEGKKTDRNGYVIGSRDRIGVQFRPKKMVTKTRLSSFEAICGECWYPPAVIG